MFFNLKDKSLGYFLAVGASLLAAILSVVYVVAYQGSDYLDVAVMGVALIGLVFAAVLSVFNVTAKYVPVVAWVAEFVAFVFFVKATYLYFSEVFYGGVSAEAFAAISPVFALCFLGLLLSAVVGNVALYLKQTKA